MNTALDELRVTNCGRVTFCNGRVTIANRRMRREDLERKASAKRSQRYRDKQKGRSDAGNHGKITPPSPVSSSAVSPSPSPTAQQNTPLPPSLDTPEFKKAWAEWEAHRKEIKKKLTPTSVKRQLARLAKNPSEAVAIIEHTIEKGWIGLREPDRPKSRSDKPPIEGGQTYDHLSENF